MHGLARFPVGDEIFPQLPEPFFAMVLMQGQQIPPFLSGERGAFDAVTQIPQEPFF